ncbi:hypothetical protein [Lentzea aerocolonigenes]|uniref:hypothetical protein n=1 Tax=Lentzea aerocolonigenes TaxID=68170 RepID=UPI000B169890|nr:hypothetical protein [Lentzea aerocolonigenes]
MLQHRTTQKSLRARREELQHELTAEPAMPDAALLDQVTEHISEVLDAGNHNQWKALMEALVVEVKVLSPDRLVPVFRVPQPDPERADTDLPVPAPEGSRRERTGGPPGTRTLNPKSKSTRLALFVDLLRQCSLPA